MVKDNEDDVELQQEEYQYSDPDSAETYAEEPQEQPPVGVRDDRRKRIILILVILGLLFVVFQFVKAKSKTAKTTEPPVVSNIEKAMQEKPVPEQAVSAQPATPVSEQQLTLDAANTNTPVSEPSAKSVEQIQSLQTSLSNLENSVKSLTEKVDVLKKQERVVKASTIQRKAKPILKRHHSIMTMKPDVYYIHAIVPRRAWLQTKNGEAITVQIGDTVPGYGVVKSIDASEGVVATSSNKMIHFDSNDN